MEVLYLFVALVFGFVGMFVLGVLVHNWAMGRAKAVVDLEESLRVHVTEQVSKGIQIIRNDVAKLRGNVAAEVKTASDTASKVIGG
jgi:hypothetical protein